MSQLGTIQRRYDVRAVLAQRNSKTMSIAETDEWDDPPPRPPDPIASHDASDAWDVEVHASSHVAARDHKRPREDGDLRQGGVLSWRMERLLRKGTFPPGPASIEELFSWPERCVERLDPFARARLSSHVRQGIIVYSDYSGIDMARESLELVIGALMKKAGDIYRACDTGIWFHRACDTGRSQRRVLVHVAKTCDGGQSCCFGNMLDRLPDVAKSYLAAASPAPTDDPRRRVEAYDDIKKWLACNGPLCFSEEAQAWCYVHEKHCKAYPPSPSEERPSALRVNVAGVTCVAWCESGRREGDAHLSELYFSVWVAERRYLQEQGREDVAFLECSAQFPIKRKLVDALPNHKVVFVYDGPELHGWPFRRRRVLAAAISKRSAQWVGPAQEDLAGHYSKIYHRAVVLKGDVLFCCPPADRQAMYRTRATDRGALAPEQLSDMTPEEFQAAILPPFAIRHLRGYEAMRADLEADDGTLIVDLEQKQGRANAGVDWPTQLTHGLVSMISRDKPFRLAIPMEHLSAMGLHVFPSVCFDRPLSKLVGAVSELTDAGVKTVAGNGMHCETQAAWMSFVLGNTQRLFF